MHQSLFRAMREAEEAGYLAGQRDNYGYNDESYVDSYGYDYEDDFGYDDEAATEYGNLREARKAAIEEINKTVKMEIANAINKGGSQEKIANDIIRIRDKGLKVISAVEAEYGETAETIKTSSKIGHWAIQGLKALGITAGGAVAGGLIGGGITAVGRYSHLGGKMDKFLENNPHIKAAINDKESKKAFKEALAKEGKSLDKINKIDARDFGRLGLEKRRTRNFFKKELDTSKLNAKSALNSLPTKVDGKIMHILKTIVGKETMTARQLEEARSTINKLMLDRNKGISLAYKEALTLNKSQFNNLINKLRTGEYELTRGNVFEIYKNVIRNSAKRGAMVGGGLGAAGYGAYQFGDRARAKF